MIFNDRILLSIPLYGKEPILITLWTFIGLTGNVLYSARVLIQWIASEKAKRSVAPKAFWWTSLAAAVVMILYSLQRATDVRFAKEPTTLPFLIGYIVTLVPYIRNLMLSYTVRIRWHILSYLAAAGIFSICIVMIVKMDIPVVRSKWFFIGMLGSLIWYTRFLWQWVYAEKEKKSTFPLSFWYMSLSGATLNLIYALIMHDLVFILSFLFNSIPISRNIILTKRHFAREKISNARN